jgi:hypothetical protein
MENSKLDNWIPYKLVNNGGQLHCYWIDTYGEPFTEPFFEETILKFKSLPGRKLRFSAVSDLDVMQEWAKDLNEIEPAAFIFHISRCGSTLVSQLLATSDENIVLSEVSFFDSILRLPYQGHNFEQAAINQLLKAAITYYGQERTGTNNPVENKNKQIFIKTDSWHLFFHKQFRHLYPSAPFVFIYRTPDEVLRSHSKVRGMQAVPGVIEPELFGFKNEEEVFEGLDIYLAKVLESYFWQCLEIIQNDKNFLLLNYSEGAITMVEKIAAFTGRALSAQDRVNMTERSRYHSKKPGEPFSEDGVDFIPPFLDRAMELYRELEEKRKSILVG